MGRTMAPDGRHDINSPDWLRVREALADPQWDFRTVDGITRVTGLASDRIRELLISHAAEVRKSYVTDKNGRILYTLRARPARLQEMVANTVAFISKSA